MENKGCKLICIGSSSLGNSYAIDSGSEILLLEAGCKMAEVKKHIDFRLSDVVGCIVTHRHGDHAKYAVEYAKSGVKMYGNEDLCDYKSFPYGTFTILRGAKVKIGSFGVMPFENFHDVPIFGYIIYHKEMGSLLFSTDSYKLPAVITNVDHFLIEANYADALLKQNVWDGKINKAQADRIMLSHMSLDYTVKYLRDCDAQKSRTIILCHLSSRHSNPDQFKSTVAGAFGVPTYIAQKGVVVELYKDII